MPTRKKPAGADAPTGSSSPKRGRSGRASGERGQPLGQPGEFARGGVLVEHAPGNAALQFGLHLRQRGGGGVLVARFQRRLELLAEGTEEGTTEERKSTVRGKRGAQRGNSGGGRRKTK